MKKTNKKVAKKQKYPIAEMAAKQLQSELAPIFSACRALSEKYAVLAALAEKNVKKIGRALAKMQDLHSPEAKRLVDQQTAWEDASSRFFDLAEELQYTPARGSNLSKVPYFSIAADIDAFDLCFLDTLAGFEDLSSAAESLGKVAAALRKVGKPTGGAALSGAKKKRSTTKTARKGKAQ